MDEPAIQDSEIVYRRIARAGDASMVFVDEQTGDIRVRGGAFVMDEDGCSVYLGSVLVAENLTPRDLVKAPQNCVVWLGVQHVRAVQLGVRPDPWPPDGDNHKRDAAHALIVNPNGLGSTRIKKARSELARGAEFCVI